MLNGWILGGHNAARWRALYRASFMGAAGMLLAVAVGTGLSWTVVASADNQKSVVLSVLQMLIECCDPRFGAFGLEATE